MMARIRRFIAARNLKHAIWRLQSARLELADAKAQAIAAEQRVIDMRLRLKSL